MQLGVLIHITSSDRPSVLIRIKSKRHGSQDSFTSLSHWFAQHREKVKQALQIWQRSSGREMAIFIFGEREEKSPCKIWKWVSY